MSSSPHPTPADSLVVYTDGGARGNPGPAACAYIIYQSPSTLLKQDGLYLGHKTNNEAEYEGILLALKALNSFSLPPHTPVVFNSDSLLIVNQLTGKYRIKEPRLAVLASAIHDLLYTIASSPTFVAIPRSQNTLADHLVNQILDRSVAETNPYS